MSLSSALQIGRSALTASQIGLQIAGNNIANAATPGYSRQMLGLAPQAGDFISQGVQIGRGVLATSVRRQIDTALQTRLVHGVADEAAAQNKASIFSTVEATLGELSDHDLSSELSGFFNTWSERANLSSSSAAVIQQGDKLSSYIRRQRQTILDLRQQIDGQIGAAVVRAEGLMAQVANLNGEIASAEVAGSEASGLRDQRDQAIADLARLLDVSVVDQGTQGLDVYVGSMPIIHGTLSRGLTSSTKTVNGDVVIKVSTRTPPTELNPTSGQLGSLLSNRAAAVGETLDSLDAVSLQLIFQVNKLHSTGANIPGLTTSSGTLRVALGDRTLALNDPTNASFADLPFAAVNGGFTVTVKQTSTGQSQTVRIDVDLDGINAAGLPGTGDDTSIEDIRAALDAVGGLTASFTSDGRLKIDADAGFDFSFADDTSGVLAVAGVNSFFDGTAGDSIAVRDEILTDPSRLMTGRVVDGTFVENATALRLAGLAEVALDDLDGRSLPAFWRDRVQTLGVRTASAVSEAQAAGDVRQSLESQRAAISGVSVDEESLNLMAFQRQYQGAARLISVANELMDTLMQLV